MQFATTTTLITLLAAVTTAAPTLNTRTPGDITLCTGADFTGDCQTLLIKPWNTCVSIPSNFKGKVGSLKVEKGALCRVTFTADTCTAHGDAFVDVSSPMKDAHHFVNAQGEQVDAGAKMTSILCQECTNCV